MKEVARVGQDLRHFHRRQSQRQCSTNIVTCASCPFKHPWQKFSEISERMGCMQNILHGLYNGKIIPWERRSPHNEKQLEIVRKIEDEERYFTEKMTLDDCQRFQALSLLQSELLASEEDHVFSYGFALGLLLMFDVMGEVN